MYSSSKGNPSRIICVVLFVAIAAVGVGLGVHYLAGGKSTVPQSLKDIQLFKKEAPFTGNPNATNRWDHTGDGLNMTIINALDQQWYTYFYTAVKNWDNGSPDALTLTTQTSQSDSSCTGVMGVIKVCNGDYGATDWKGINTVLLDSNGFITTSSARMNDHFFTSGGDDAKRLYTMCHEIGHGFGLPHTDEHYWNRDLGNCLDYTNNYSGNDTPDLSLYTFLAELYGTVNGTAPTVVGNPPAQTSAPGTGTSAPGFRRMQLRGSPDDHIFQAVESESKRRELLSAWDKINSFVVSGFVGSERQGWRLLHRTPYGEAHEIDLGEDYTVQVHMLQSN